MKLYEVIFPHTYAQEWKEFTILRLFSGDTHIDVNKLHLLPLSTEQLHFLANPRSTKEIFLAEYCQNCKKSFSVRESHSKSFFFLKFARLELKAKFWVEQKKHCGIFCLFVKIPKSS